MIVPFSHEVVTPPQVWISNKWFRSALCCFNDLRNVHLIKYWCMPDWASSLLGIGQVYAVSSPTFKLGILFLTSSPPRLVGRRNSLIISAFQRRPTFHPSHLQRSPPTKKTYTTAVRIFGKQPEKYEGRGGGCAGRPSVLSYLSVQLATLASSFLSNSLVCRSYLLEFSLQPSFTNPNFIRSSVRYYCQRVLHPISPSTMKYPFSLRSVFLD